MITQELVEILKQQMLLKEAKSEGAYMAYRKAKLQLCNENYRFKQGQKIFVQYSNGPIDYIFEKIDWHFYNRYEPVIFAHQLLKNGKLSKHGPLGLLASNGAICWDSKIVFPKQDE
jgi:hypothetical protein